MYWDGSWGSLRQPSCARARPRRARRRRSQHQAPCRRPALPDEAGPATLTPARTQLSQAGRKLASTLHGK